MNEFMYGTTGGMTGVLLSHPFDTIKTRMQSKQALSIQEAVLQSSNGHSLLQCGLVYYLYSESTSLYSGLL